MAASSAPMRIFSEFFRAVLLLSSPLFLLLLLRSPFLFLSYASDSSLPHTLLSNAWGKSSFHFGKVPTSLSLYAGATLHRRIFPTHFQKH
jgi:hypothetical protein